MGWTTARIEFLDTRPIQCYRCWAFGHIQAKCDSEVDRRRLCFRCGSAGHKFEECFAPFNCILCATSGKNAQHRLGSVNCDSLPKKESLEQRQAVITGPDNANNPV